MRSCRSPAGRLESHQRGFWIETPFQIQKTKALRWLSPECVRRVEKYNTVRQAYSYFGGYMLRKYQGENLRSDSNLHIRSLPHDLVMGGIPHAGSWQYLYWNSIPNMGINYYCYKKKMKRETKIGEILKHLLLPTTQHVQEISFFLCFFFWILTEIYTFVFLLIEDWRRVPSFLLCCPAFRAAITKYHKLYSL